MRTAATLSCGELHTHVLRICSDNNIALTWGAIRNSAGTIAATGGRDIELRCQSIRLDTDYGMALHECGHHLGCQSSDLLTSEQYAWDWARENALTWTPRMQRYSEICLDAYRRNPSYDNPLPDPIYDAEWRKMWSNTVSKPVPALIVTRVRMRYP